MDTKREGQGSKKSDVYGKSAIAPIDDSYARVAAWFLGPKAENKKFLKSLILRSIDDYTNLRENYYHDDQKYITNNIKNKDSYRIAQDKIVSSLAELMERLHGSIPFFSPRYQAHMNWDTVLPGSLGYMAAILYNQNNVATEGGPATSRLEMEVGQQLCEMLGFDLDSSWGHITADGTIANLEAMWMARNLKFYPHAIQSMLINSDNEEIIKGRNDILVELGPEKIRLIDLNSWQLLNLRGDLIVELPGIVGDKCFPEMESDARMKIVGDLLGPYLIQNIGLLDFARDHRDVKGMRVFVPATKHYSWPKAGTILGIGQDSIIGVDVNERCQMDTLSLEKELRLCAMQKIPVLMVVAVIGSTEEGAIDDLAAILGIRDELHSKYGMWFNVHCDAAWGGYLVSMIRDKNDKMISHQDVGYVPILTLSKHAHKQLSNIYKADTVTIDPHKAGFIPYPAGSLCYRNKAMRELITFNAAYIHSNPDTNMGIYGVEGSKPGAAAAAVWLAHMSIPLNQDGYGRILGECMFSANIYYCYWLTLAKDTDNFRIEPIVPLPELVFDGKGMPLAKGDNAIKEFIRKHILGKPNEKIAEDPDAMAVLSQLGSDVLTNSFVVNFRGLDGSWNVDLEKCKELNSKLFHMFSIVDDTSEEDRKRVEFVLTYSEIDSKHYKVALESVCKKLGLVYDIKSDYTLNFLINTILDPWPTTHDYVKMITDSFRKGIYACIEEMDEGQLKGA